MGLSGSVSCCSVLCCSVTCCSGLSRLGRGSFAAGREDVPRLAAFICLAYSIARFTGVHAERGVKTSESTGLMLGRRPLTFLDGVLNSAWGYTGIYKCGVL